MRSFVAITALLALLGSISLASSNTTNEGTLILGLRQQYDYLLQQQTVDVSSVPFLKRDKILTIAGNGVAVISAIEVIDTKNKGNTVKSKITSGGLGSTYVTIHLKSHRGHGLHYLIKVYGH